MSKENIEAEVLPWTAASEATDNTPTEEKKESYTEKDKQEMFEKKVSEVDVPVSVATNKLRADLNKAIEEATSVLHIEYVLEVFRNAVFSIEQSAYSLAQQESQDYFSKIEAIRKEISEI